MRPPDYRLQQVGFAFSFKSKIGLIKEGAQLLSIRTELLRQEMNVQTK